MRYIKVLAGSGLTTAFIAGRFIPHLSHIFIFQWLFFAVFAGVKKGMVWSFYSG
jgi:hypothetical protein